MVRDPRRHKLIDGEEWRCLHTPVPFSPCSPCGRDNVRSGIFEGVEAMVKGRRRVQWLKSICLGLQGKKFNSFLHDFLPDPIGIPALP